MLPHARATHARRTGSWAPSGYSRNAASDLLSRRWVAWNVHAKNSATCLRARSHARSGERAQTRARRSHCDSSRARSPRPWLPNAGTVSTTARANAGSAPYTAGCSAAAARAAAHALAYLHTVT